MNAFSGDAITRLEEAMSRIEASLHRQEQLLGVMVALLQRPEFEHARARGVGAAEPRRNDSEPGRE